jgi:hypothetical protein
MDVWHWVALAAGAWLVLSCAVGLTLGLVVRRRDSLEAEARQNSLASVADLEALFTLDDRSVAR